MKPAEELEAARKAGRSENWLAAADLLWPIVRRQVPADEESVQEAQYQLAFALNRLAGRHASTKREIEAHETAYEILSAIQEQPHHRRRREAAEWICRHAGGRLVELSDKQRKLYATAAPTPAEPAGAPAPQRLATVPDCSAQNCPSGPSVVCLDTEARTAKCSCDVDACVNGSGNEVVLCKGDGDCPSPGEGVFGTCDLDLTQSEGVPPPAKACVYRFTHGVGREAVEIQAHEEAAKKAAAAAKGADDFAAGERAARAATDMQGQTEALRHFSAACDAGNTEGCARAAEFVTNAYGTKQDMPRAIKLTARACKLGRSLSCTDDLGCVESTDVAYVGRQVSRNSMRVTKTIGVQTIGRCERYCAQGLPGACHTAGNYQSTAGRDAKAKKSFERSCKLGNKADCE